MSRILCFCLIIISLGFSCWGTRPLAMGGAFVAVADDVNSVYWNPAGLGKISGGECTFAKNVGGVNDTNYDLYLASSVYDPVNKFGYAGAFVSDTTELSLPFSVDVTDNGTVIGRLEQQTTYIQLAAGKKLEFIPGLYYGMGIKQIQNNFVERYNKAQYNLSIVDDKSFEIDLGLLYDFGPKISTRNTLFSIGILGQNISEAKSPKLQFDYVSNVRPGIAIRPDSTWTISAEWYHINGDGKTGSDTKDLRIGIEKTLFDEHLALRYGQYHENNEDMKAYTYGLAINWFDLSAQYTCMDWAKDSYDGEDTKTIMYGLTYKMDPIPR